MQSSIDSTGKCGNISSEAQQRPQGWIDVTDPFEPSRLLFKYDRERQLVEIQKRGIKRVIDLTQVGK